MLEQRNKDFLQNNEIKPDSPRRGVGVIGAEGTRGLKELNYIKPYRTKVGITQIK